MHAPPGGDLATTGGDVDPQGHIAQPTMMLQASPQQHLLEILAARRGALVAAFTGHTHMDEYRMAVVAMQGLPGITSDMGNAPAFKTFTVSGGSALQDYVSWTLDLGHPVRVLPALIMNFSTAYGLPPPLETSLAALLPKLMTSPTDQFGATRVATARPRAIEAHHRPQLAGLLVRHRVHGVAGARGLREPALTPGVDSAASGP